MILTSLYCSRFSYFLFQIEWLFLSMSMINRFIRSGYPTKYTLSSLHYIFCGGSILKSKLQDELRSILPHILIAQGYGM